VVCGLVAATLAALVYGLGPGARDARAGAPQDWQAAQAVAVPAPTVELYPTNTAPATGGTAAAPEAKSPQMVVNDQAAGAATSVTQSQPTNVVVSIRIDSPGDNGPITQTNVAIGGANGTNDAATSQGGSGASGGGGQDASTDQQAGADTTVTQDEAGNLVVTVRINSPGNNGPVSQTNAAVGSSNAQNTSGTSQGGQTEAPAPSTAPKKAAAGGKPGHASRRHIPRQDRQEQATAAAPASASPVAQAPTWHDGADATAASAVRAHHSNQGASGRGAHRGRTAPVGSSSAERASESPLGRAIGRAGDLLGTVAPRAPTGAPTRPADVSHPVLYSLLAAIALGTAFVAWSRRPAWRRQRRFGNGLPR
jgi:hypothetical protein